MAVVSKVATIKYDNGLGSTKTFAMTAAVQDTAAGSSVVVTTSRVNVGAIPPADPDTLLLEWVDDAGNVVKSVSRANPTAFPFTDTFFFTANGNAGGGNRCGTLELRMRVTKTTGGPTATYDTRSDGAPNTPPTTFTATQLDRGWIRGTTTLVEAISNISLGGGKTSPAEYNESLFVRLTQADASYVARALSVAISNTTPSLTGNTNSSSTITHDITFSNVVDNRFPASVQTAAVSETIPNATLTGQPDWAYTATTDDSISVDPRLTCAHLLQINDSTFGTPPLTKQGADGKRSNQEIGFLTTNIRASRGTQVGTATTEGKNGLSVHTTMQDAAQLTTALTLDDTTATKGGEAGWVQSFLQWLSALPGGTWNKTVTVTAPSNITGASYLVNSTISYILLAPNPNVGVVIEIHPENIAGHGSHLTPVDKLIPVAYLFDHTTNALVQLVEANGDFVVMTATRTHHPTMRLDYFDFVADVWVQKADGASIPAAGQISLVRGSVHTVGGDPDVWTVATHIGGAIFAETSAGELDLVLEADIVKDGIHYTAFTGVVLVGPYFKHNSKNETTMPFDSQGINDIHTITGTGQISNDGNIVTGTGTTFTTQLSAGRLVRFDAESTVYEVFSVDSDTSIRIFPNYTGTTGSGKVMTSPGSGHSHLGAADNSAAIGDRS